MSDAFARSRPGLRESAGYRWGYPRIKVYIYICLYLLYVLENFTMVAGWFVGFCRMSDASARSRRKLYESAGYHWGYQYIDMYMYLTYTKLEISTVVAVWPLGFCRMSDALVRSRHKLRGLPASTGMPMGIYIYI